jgi:hypothetical protein
VIALPAVPRYPFVMRVRRILTVFVLATVLASCGGGDAERVATEDPYAVLRAAPEATVDGGAAKVSYTIEVAGETIEMDGVADLASNVFAIEVPVPGAGESMQVMTVGTTMYMSLPEEGRVELDVDTPWVSVDLERAGEATSGIAGSFGSNDPAESLSALEGVSEDGIENLGTESVRGVETTHYRATVDLGEALENAGEIVDREAFERYLEELGDETARYDIWLDADGVIRKMGYDMPMAGVNAVIAVEFYDFGEAELPAIPAPGDVTDITDEAIAQGNQQES